MSIPSVSIENKNGVAMLIDEEDLGLLTQHKDGHWCFTVQPKGYAQIFYRIELGGRGSNPVFFHRLLMGCPIGMQVCHINKDRLDNRKKNLQICTPSKKNMITAGYGKSRFKGVSPNGKRWRAFISADGGLKHIGTFDTELEAALSYDAAARLQGNDSHFLNFPDEDTNA